MFNSNLRIILNPKCNCKIYSLYNPWNSLQWRYLLLVSFVFCFYFASFSRKLKRRSLKQQDNTMFMLECSVKYLNENFKFMVNSSTQTLRNFNKYLWLLFSINFYAVPFGLRKFLISLAIFHRKMNLNENYF